MRTYTSIFIPFLLTLLHNFPASTGATPQQSLRNTSIPTKLHVLGDPDPFLDDPCGPPEAPRTGRPGSKSTCGTVVADDLPAGSPFKLSCQMDNTGFIMNWDTCGASVNAACAALALATNPAVDRWVWAPPGSVFPFPLSPSSINSHLPQVIYMDHKRPQFLQYQLDVPSKVAKLESTQSSTRRRPAPTELFRRLLEPFKWGAAPRLRALQKRHL
ncbi:MAG: hypothetical protein LQ343_003587 [Gyalolechia ehrenbergii]|nr:MAG: hypothetical protein LQ343_003587 [Gyalolechia ehrenbergii]